MNKWAKLGIVIVVLVAAALAGFAIWAYTPPAPMPEALAALESDASVQVQTEPWLVFEPVGEARDTGFVIYPGGRVDPRSYAPTARAMAEAGYPTVIVPMPFNLAVFGVGQADEVLATFPEVESWVIGGHSLGGAMAASYVYSHPDIMDGLALWAAYPADNNSLADRDGLAVTSIYGTLDGLATGDKIDASRALLPPSTVWVPIQGGNHAQFGWYGPQSGDNEATISREQQQQQVVEATLDLLNGLSGP
ncbi:MAG: alpha/beta hydrolase [Anaerolineae bacterium]